MSAVNYNIRIDSTLRDEAFAVLDSYGLTPSQAFKLFLKQVASTGKVPLSFDYQHKLSKNGEKLLQESLDDIQQGRYTTCSGDELIHHLVKLADD